MHMLTGELMHMLTGAHMHILIGTHAHDHRCTYHIQVNICIH